MAKPSSHLSLTPQLWDDLRWKALQTHGLPDWVTEILSMTLDQARSRERPHYDPLLLVPQVYKHTRDSYLRTSELVRVRDRPDREFQKQRRQQILRDLPNQDL